MECIIHLTSPNNTAISDRTEKIKDQTSNLSIYSRCAIYSRWRESCLETTSRKTNMFVENEWLEDVFPIEI